LHFACQQGRLKVVEKLLEAKADINAKTKTGATPLFVATLKGNLHLKVVETLLKASADVIIKRDDGIGPLEVAALNGQRDLVKLLKKYVQPGWFSACKDFDIPDGHVLVLEVHSRGVKVSASLNGEHVRAFLGKKGMNNPAAHPNIQAEFLKKGDNKLALIVEDLGEKVPGEVAEEEDRPEGWVAMRSYPRGVLQGDPSGISYLHLEWTGPGQLPANKEQSFTLPEQSTKEKPVDKAEKITLNDESKKELSELIDKLHKAYSKGDFDTIWKFGEPMRQTMSASELEGVDIKELTKQTVAAAKRVGMVPLNPEEFDFKLIADDKMVTCNYKNGFPILRSNEYTNKENGQQQESYPMAVGKIGGKWFMLAGDISGGR